MKRENIKEPKYNDIDKGKLKCSEKFLPLHRTPTFLNSPAILRSLQTPWCYKPSVFSECDEASFGICLYTLRQNYLIFKRWNTILLSHTTLLKWENGIETSRASQPVTQHHVPVEQRPQLQLSYGYLFYDTVWRVHALYTSHSLLEDMWGWWYVAPFLPITIWEKSGKQQTRPTTK